MTAIRDVTVFDATGRAPFVADILVSEGRFRAIGPGIDAPPNAHVIDGSGLSIIPGLIDVHVHWTTMDGATRSDIATKLLLHGVTTTTDFHSAPESFGVKRNWHEQLVSPNVLYAARMSTPGGHGASWGDHNMTRLVTSAREGEFAVEAIEGYKADLVKIFADGWRYGGRVNNSSMSIDAIAAIAAHAKALNLPVVSHTVTVDGAKAAAEAGVTSIVHAIQDREVDDELVQLMNGNRVFYAPSLAVYEPRADKIAGMDADQMQLVLQRQRLSRTNLSRLYQAGVPVALGSDSGIAATPFGESSLRELELLVDFGLSASDALLAGTANGAELLGLLGDRGTIEVGKRADFVLVRGQPWRNISDLRELESVFVGGVKLVEKGELQAKQGSSLPKAVSAQRLIDDFERQDDLTASGASRLVELDEGYPRSISIIQKTDREVGGSALLLAARMALKNSPRALVGFPMTRGGFLPVDATKFHGISFEARGDAGAYQLEIVASSFKFNHTFKAGPKWETIRIPFAALVTDAGNFLLDSASISEVRIGAERLPGEAFWMELDNVRFFDIH